jgi:hypothetical protein
MTEKFTPSSTSNIDNLPITTPPKAKAAFDDFAFVLRRQPPAFVFCDEHFEFEVGLESTRGSQHSPPSDVDIHAAIHRPSVSASRSSILVTMVEEARVSASRRMGKVKCRVSGCEPGASFQIHVSARGGRGITPVVTNTMHAVKAKLFVTVEQSWGDVWYKDEGGRDKCLEVLVSARDKADDLLCEAIPLQLTLCYAGAVPVEVSNQEVLRIIGSDRKMHIDKQTGTTKIRFRIEDVSKNHQGQDFVLKIQADTKSALPIAPAYTPAVSVRSKRNKRQRSSTATSSGRSSSSADKGRASPTRHLNPAQGLIDPLAADLDSLRDAIQNVSQWTDEVVNGLYPLQWQVIGYAQNPDGSPDYSRPYHSMTNPNAVISRVLSEYADNVRDNLRLIQNAVEQSATASQPDTPIPYSHIVRDSFGLLSPTAGPPADSPQGRYNEDAYRDYNVQPASFYHRSTTPPSGHLPMDDHSRRRPPSPLDKVPRIAQQASVRRSSDDSQENKVEYVVAKQYKSVRTGERLGFPAFSASKEIVGFYHEAGHFMPIKDFVKDFGPMEIMQATQILEQAIASKSDAVHSRKEWGSISNLVDHCLVYNFSKDIGPS